jgi:hypothetical protein
MTPVHVAANADFEEMERTGREMGGTGREMGGTGREMGGTGAAMRRSREAMRRSREAMRRSAVRERAISREMRGIAWRATLIWTERQRIGMEIRPIGVARWFARRGRRRSRLAPRPRAE